MIPYCLFAQVWLLQDWLPRTVTTHLAVQAYHKTDKTFAVYINDRPSGMYLCFLPHIYVPEDILALLE